VGRARAVRHARRADDARSRRHGGRGGVRLTPSRRVDRGSHGRTGGVFPVRRPTSSRRCGECIGSTDGPTSPVEVPAASGGTCSNAPSHHVRAGEPLKARSSFLSIGRTL
jgi:hypothetical protein